MHEDRVLYLCTGNSARLQMAEAIVKARRFIQRRYLAEIAEHFPFLVLHILYLSGEMKGLEALTEFGDLVHGRERVPVVSKSEGGCGF